MSPTETAAARPNAYELDLARLRVFEVMYNEYRELAVTYLDPAFVAMYQSQAEWERMALHVATTIDAMRARIT